MGVNDWTYLTDSLDAATVRRGVTAAIECPPGGGDFLFAFHSMTVAPGAVGLAVNQQDFTPLGRGGSIRGCLRRGPSGGPTGFSTFMFLGLQGPSVNDRCYLLGLADEDPHRIVLRKGALRDGIPDGDGLDVLLVSSASSLLGEWHHLRLDAISNPNGDVVLAVFRNDLALHPLGSPPAWEPIAGMPMFVDDPLGIRSGSPALTSGRAGFGFATRDITRRAYVDHVEVLRQV